MVNKLLRTDILLLTKIIIFVSCFFIASPIFAIEPISVVTIDPNINTGYGTFQSHNQKVVINQYGIFMTHLNYFSTNNETNQWKLSRSTDLGKTFTTIYQETGGTNAPVIETDNLGNIYLAHPNWQSGGTTASLYVLTPQTNFSNPTLLATIPNSAHGKYSMIIDEPRGQLYFLSASGVFSTINMNGQIKNNYTILKGGNNAYQQYPHLYLDSNGTLYVAWTNQKYDLYMYWDIHFMLSRDGGITWQRPNGTSLTPPIISDNTGPTDRITLDDEYDYHTWLSNFIVKNNKAHFMYYTQGLNRQHYIRYDLVKNTIDKRLYPGWKADSISLRTFDGFFVTDPNNSNSPLFAIGKAVDGRLVAVVSYDNGDSWHDYASSSFNNQNLYSIGGFRKISSDGSIIGSYTDQGSQNDVRFFKLSTTTNNPTPSPTPKPGDLNGDGSVDLLDFNKLIKLFGNPYTLLDFNAIIRHYGS